MPVTPPDAPDPPPARTATPTILLLPGWLGSGPDHWQGHWARLHGDRWVEQHDWAWPRRGDWMARLDEVVQATPGPLRLAAHSLGAHLVAAWAAHSRHATRVDAALLVAPPDLDAASLPPALHRWRPAVLEPLPFRSLLVASDDDPYATVAASQRLASAWRADERLVACGGHLNAASGLADWPQARAWLLAL